MTENFKDWLELDLEEMEATMVALGESKFRARQLADWIY